MVWVGIVNSKVKFFGKIIPRKLEAREDGKVVSTSPQCNVVKSSLER